MKHFFLIITYCYMLISAANAQEIPVTFRQSDQKVDMSIALPKDTSYALIQRGGITTITIGSTRKINSDVLRKSLPKSFSIQKILPKDRSLVLQLSTPGYRMESHTRKKYGILVEYVADDTVPATAATPPKPLPKPDLSQTPGSSTLSETSSDPDPTPPPLGTLDIEDTTHQAKLVFTFPEERAMVSFLRDGYYWFVFNHPHPLEVKGILPKSFGELEQRLDSPMIIFELKHSPDIFVSITKETTKWTVSLGRQPDKAKGQTQERTDLKGKLEYSSSETPIYSIRTEHEDIEYSFTDPRRGDRILLVPLKDQGKHFESSVNFSDFQILESEQGIVIVPYTPDLDLDLSTDSIIIKRPDGLRVSSRQDREKSLTHLKNSNNLDFQHWALPGENYVDTRNRLEREIAEAPQSKRIEAYYKLIRFNLARGYGVEALGLLRILSDDIPGLIHDAQFLALRGVAYFLAGNSSMALHDFTARELEHVNEVQLWKGAALNNLKKTAEGTELFAKHTLQIESLPSYLKVLMALNGAMAALQENELGLAQQLEAIMQNTPIPPTQKRDYDLLQAFLAEKNDDVEQAEHLLTEVARHQDSKASAQAAIELIHNDLEAATITVEDAIKRMESLRYRWRNSDLEWQILKDLSQLYLNANNYKNALSTMAVALKYYPNAPDYQKINDLMVESFKNLFSRENEHHISPITAVSIYESFKSLTPQGPDGDDIIIGLAHNLEQLDLPEQAVEALEKRYKASVAPTPKLAQEYAIALLESNQSQKALETIERAQKQKLDRDERGKLLYLKVKALANLKRYPEAIQLLQNDTSEIAEKLRAGLYWKAKQWNKAAENLWNVLDKQKDKDKDPQLLMNYALMLYKAKDFKRSQEIKKKYTKLMQDSPYREAFEVLTTPDYEDNIQLNNLDFHLAQVDKFEVLLGKEEK